MGLDLFVGIDVGARRVHAVALDGAGAVRWIEVVAVAGTVPGHGIAVAPARLAAGAAGVAVDAPDRWSTAPHRRDLDLPPKFRTARCAEIGLGRDHGLWVPWTTPVEPAPGTWIAAGIGLFAALRAGGHDPAEVYPYAAFRVLNGGRRPAPKTTPAGRAQRLALLAAAGIRGVPPDAGHDVLDAAVAAVVARLRHVGGAVAATCGHDGTAIWLPAGVAEPAVPAV